MLSILRDQNELAENNNDLSYYYNQNVQNMLNTGIYDRPMPAGSEDDMILETLVEQDLE